MISFVIMLILLHNLMGSELLVQELSILLWYYLKIINSAKGNSFKGRQWNNETEWRFNNTYSDEETDAGPRHGGRISCSGGDAGKTSL